MKVFYFDLEHAVREHDFIIERSGGRHGHKDLGLIDSVLEHIKNDMYYPEIHDKVTHLCYSIIKNHGFVDGNKRSSIVLTSYFLEINGLSYCIDRFIREMENYARYVAANFISQEMLSAIIQSMIYELDYNEDLKLRIANALANNLPIEDEMEDVESNNPF